MMIRLCAVLIILSGLALAGTFDHDDPGLQPYIYQCGDTTFISERWLTQPEIDINCLIQETEPELDSDFSFNY